MRMSHGGAMLEPNEISKIQEIMGQQGFYKKELQRIQREAENLTYTYTNGKEIKGFVNIIKAQRRGFVSSEYVDTTQYKRIFAKITTAYNRAKKKAEGALPVEMRISIREREQARIRLQRQNEYGLLQDIEEENYGVSEILNLAK